MNSILACSNLDDGRMDLTPFTFVSCPDDSDIQGAEDHASIDNVSPFIRDLIMISFDNQIGEEVRSLQCDDQKENSSEIVCQEILNNMLNNTISRCEEKPAQNEDIWSKIESEDQDEDLEKSSEDVCQEILNSIFNNVIIICSEKNPIDITDDVITGFHVNPKGEEIQDRKL